MIDKRRCITIGAYRMVLICCNHVLNLTGDFRGPFRGPLYPLKPGVSRGPAPSGPLVIRPLQHIIEHISMAKIFAIFVCPSVCLSSTLMQNISETKRLEVCVQ